MITWHHHNCSQEVLQSIQALLAKLDDDHGNFRLWAKDASIFTGTDEAAWLDWLTEPKDLLATVSSLKTLHDKIRAQFSSVVLLGMGGSSLSARVFQQILAPTSTQFLVLDTIHPDTLENIERSIDLTKTLFIVASKSGSTLEPNLLYEHFRDRLINASVADPFRHFMAITDPVTSLEQESVENGFLPGAFGKPGIGGRYSGLSVFGIVPAIFMGIDVERLLNETVLMAKALGPSVQAHDNGAATLAAFLVANLAKSNQVFIHLPAELCSLGSWLEQLIAESLGKDGKGIVPVVTGQQFSNQALESSHVVISFKDDTKAEFPAPHFHVMLTDKYEIGAVMFGFQMAVAILGSIIKVNPFNQPDVESSKKRTKEIIDQLAKGQNTDDALAVSSLEITQFIAAIQPGDYVAILSFLDETNDNGELLAALKTALEQKTSAPTLVQTGPRYLHSTGQLFKGGKNNGHFLVITGPYESDLLSSRDNLTFAAIHYSQALGDILALKECGRRVLHLNVKGAKEVLGVVNVISG